MTTRFKVGDVINYNTSDKCFSYCNGNYVVVSARIARFSDNNEEFQDLACVEIGNKHTVVCHFIDASTTPNPHLSLVDINNL